MRDTAAPDLPEDFAAGTDDPFASSGDDGVRLTGLDDVGGLFAMRDKGKFKN
jgi:hypothetical protein